MEASLEDIKNIVDAAIAKGPGSEEFDIVRKMAAMSIFLASNGNVSPEAAASQADGAVFEKAVEHQAGEEKLSEEEVVELLENRQASSFVAMCRSFIVEAVENGCTVLGGLIGTKLGHPVIGAKIGTAVGRFLNKPVGKIVEAGAKKVLSWTAEALSWAEEATDSLADKAVEWINAL
jgi:hypothetical protein